MVTRSDGSRRTRNSAPVCVAADSPHAAACAARPYLTCGQIDEFRGLLLRRRSELIGDLVQLDSELHRTRDDPDKGDGLECGTGSGQTDVTAGLLHTGWGELREINEALERMDQGTYGLCAASGAPIGLARLRARPWAKYCIESARAMERSRHRKAAADREGESRNPSSEDEGAEPW